MSSLRLALWLEGFEIDAELLAKDLSDVGRDFAKLRSLRGPRNDDLVADRLVIEMLDSRNPNPLIQLGSAKIADREELAAGLLNMFQLLLGTPPRDLELDAVSAKPLSRLLHVLWPPLVIDPASVGEMFANDDDVMHYMEELGRLPAWTVEDWSRGRDDALLLFRSGKYPPLPHYTHGMMWLGMRISSVAGSIALRHLNPESWDTQIQSLRL